MRCLLQIRRHRGVVLKLLHRQLRCFVSSIGSRLPMPGDDACNGQDGEDTQARCEGHGVPPDDRHQMQSPLPCNQGERGWGEGVIVSRGWAWSVCAGCGPRHPRPLSPDYGGRGEKLADTWNATATWCEGAKSELTVDFHVGSKVRPFQIIRGTSTNLPTRLADGLGLESAPVLRPAPVDRRRDPVGSPVPIPCGIGLGCWE